MRAPRCPQRSSWASLKTAMLLYVSREAKTDEDASSALRQREGGPMSPRNVMALSCSSARGEAARILLSILIRTASLRTLKKAWVLSSRFVQWPAYVVQICAAERSSPTRLTVRMPISATTLEVERVEARASRVFYRRLGGISTKTCSSRLWLSARTSDFGLRAGVRRRRWSRAARPSSSCTRRT